MVRWLKNIKHLLFAVWVVVSSGYPGRNLTVIGVTGTDGKTTTVHLIGAILKEGRFKVAVVSTIGAWLGDEKIETGFHVTTPGSQLLQKLLSRIAREGYTHVVLEATSQGLDQHRLLGCNFKIGVVTNVTRDHFDYHKTHERYLEAKAKLFDGVEIAVLNKDDQSYNFLNVRCKERGQKVVTYGLYGAEITPENFSFKTRLPGEHNTYNCLAAISVALNLGVESEVIQKAVAKFEGLPGRLEEIKNKNEFRVFVDFAHTPAAFEKVLATVRKETSGELIHVFGCTGNRDKEKRPLMGEISANLSDKIVLTHEDTYDEEPEKILADIEAGVRKGGKVLGKDYWKILERREAIWKAIRMAKKGDSVLITGVGHQSTLNIKGKEVPWSDPGVVRQILTKS